MHQVFLWLYVMRCHVNFHENFSGTLLPLLSHKIYHDSDTNLYPAVISASRKN